MFPRASECTNVFLKLSLHSALLLWKQSAVFSPSILNYICQLIQNNQPKTYGWKWMAVQQSIAQLKSWNTEHIIQKNIHRTSSIHTWDVIPLLSMFKWCHGMAKYTGSLLCWCIVMIFLYLDSDYVCFFWQNMMLINIWRHSREVAHVALVVWEVSGKDFLL